MRIYGTYTTGAWDEKDIEVFDETKKLTRVSAEFVFTGDIDGLAKVEYLMFYSAFDPANMHASKAQYVGQIRIVGKLQGKSGSFVLNDSGNFTDGVASSELWIIAESGTGELSSISGVGEYSADAKGCTWEMEISL